MEIKERARLEEGKEKEKEKEKECAANGGYSLCYFVPLCLRGSEEIRTDREGKDPGRSEPRGNKFVECI
jgi:hypothetical protein